MCNLLMASLKRSKWQLSEGGTLYLCSTYKLMESLTGSLHLSERGTLYLCM